MCVYENLKKFEKTKQTSKAVLEFLIVYLRFWIQGDFIIFAYDSI